MSRPDTDDYGFPLPKKFGDDSQKQPVDRSAGRTRILRVGFALLLVAIVIALVSESPIGDRLRDAAAASFLRSADEKYSTADLPGALADLDTALSLAEHRGLRVSILLTRSACRIDAGDLQGALDDCNRAIELESKYAAAYMRRSYVLQRLGRHREAIDDLNAAVAHRDAHDPEPFNNRAYARALANTELKEAMDDIQRAMEIAQVEKSHFLDTRGYLHFLLGDYQAALADLDRAIEVGERERDQQLRMLASRGTASALTERVEREWNQALGVMHHHRGEVHQKLGNREAAQSDLRRGDELGYNPAAGVF